MLLRLQGLDLGSGELPQPRISGPLSDEILLPPYFNVIKAGFPVRAKF
jgi:hypothetical protein